MGAAVGRWRTGSRSLFTHLEFFNLAVESYFKQDMAEGVKAVILNTEEVQTGGDWAFERGTYRLEGNRGAETGA